jgi:protein TonB
MSELGSLSNCMVDSDLDSLGRARSVRRKALVLSSALELAILAALLLWPLITPGVLSQRATIMPLPPFHGLPQTQAAPQHANQAPVAQSPHFRIPIFVTVLRPPQRSASQTRDLAPPGNFGPSSPLNDSLAFVFPGGSERGPAIGAPPRPNANSSRPVRVSIGVMQGSLIHRVEPAYPAIAKTIHLGGEVDLRAIIRTDGSIGELTVLSGNPILAIAAQAAVREWRYKPTLLNGQPVEVETIITVNFVLE